MTLNIKVSIAEGDWRAGDAWSGSFTSDKHDYASVAMEFKKVCNRRWVIQKFTLDVFNLAIQSGKFSNKSNKDNYFVVEISSDDKSISSQPVDELIQAFKDFTNPSLEQANEAKAYGDLRDALEKWKNS